MMQRKVLKEELALAKRRDKGKIAEVVFCSSLKLKNKHFVFQIGHMLLPPPAHRSHGIPAESRRRGYQERNPTLSRTSSC